MTSQARIDANRRNAQKSTGPRTPRGKARSSRNGRTHGLAAGTIRLTAAEARAFGTTMTRWVAACRPADDAEREAIGRAALATVMLHRITKAEAEAIRVSGEWLPDAAVKLVLRYQPRWRRALHEAIEEMRGLQERWSDRATDAQDEPNENSTQPLHPTESESTQTRRGITPHSGSSRTRPRPGTSEPRDEASALPSRGSTPGRREAEPHRDARNEPNGFEAQVIGMDRVIVANPGNRTRPGRGVPMADSGPMVRGHAQTEPKQNRLQDLLVKLLGPIVQAGSWLTAALMATAWVGIMLAGRRPVRSRTTPAPRDDSRTPVGPEPEGRARNILILFKLGTRDGSTPPRGRLAGEGRGW